MKEFTTEKGTKLYYEVDYQLGGFNFFNGENDPRCYSLSIQKSPQEFPAFTDLNDDRGAVRLVLFGAVRLVLFEVGRQSKKQRSKAESMALDKLKEFLSEHYSNL